MSKTIFAVLAIICLTGACAFNTGSSKLSYGDRLTTGFPKRVAVATLGGDLTSHAEATDRLSRGLVDLGFQVATSSGNVDRELRRSADGVSETIPEGARKKLAETYGLQGIFVGTLSQDKGNFINETRLSLKLISVGTGKLVWSASVLGEGVVGFSGGVKDTAVAATEEALRELEKELYVDPKGDPQKSGQGTSALPLKKSQPE